MSANGLLKLDERQAQQIAQALLARQLGYVPGWTPVEGGFGWASVQIYARFLQALAECLNQAPDKNKLAFLDMLGVNLLPAQAARAPVVFEMQANARNSRAPARTRLEAKAPGQSEPLIFETENTIGLAAARLAEVRSVWPPGDEYAEHSVAAIGGQPFTLFEPRQRVPHELYLAHDTLFALAGEATVELDFTLASPSDRELDIEWTYWDSRDQDWHKFLPFGGTDQDSIDGTTGLTKNGIIRLLANDAEAKQTVVNGHEASWIRGRLQEPLTPDLVGKLPLVDHVQVCTVINRELQFETETGVEGGLDPDQAFADGQKLDLSKAFYPFGPLAGQGSAFYFACEEIASKPGAQVTVCVQKKETEWEKADNEIALYEQEVQDVERLLNEARSNAQDIDQKLNEMLGGILAYGDGLPSIFEMDPKEWHQNLKKMFVDWGKDLKGEISSDPPKSPSWWIAYLASLAASAWEHPDGGIRFEITHGNKDEAVDMFSNMLVDLMSVLTDFFVDATTGTTIFQSKLEELKTAVNMLQWDHSQVVDFGLAFANLMLDIENELKKQEPRVYPSGGGDLPDFFVEFSPSQNWSSLQDWWDSIRKALDDRGISALNELVIEFLNLLTPIEAAALRGVTPPALPEVQLAWEYWDGERWQPLDDPEEPVAAANSGDVPAANLLDSGWFSFTVPEDMASILINGIEARWMRARIAGGTYHKLTIVSWQDQEGSSNVLPVIEPRPPVLDAFSLGYSYEPPWDIPEHCLTHNDFQFQDHTQDILLFSTVPQYQNDLDQGVLSTSLRDEFVDRGISLSQDCEIILISESTIWESESQELKQKVWEIRDQNWTFRILTVYTTTMDAIIAGLPPTLSSLVVFSPGFFEPFSAVSDDSPTLYLGLDRPLPTDLISLYLDIQEQESPDLARDSVDWEYEYWDGTEWSTLSVYHDETCGLTRPGMVAFTWPGVNTSPPAAVVQASGDQVQLLDPRDAARFRPGDQVYVAEKDAGELATVVESSGDRLTLKTPLSQDYGRAMVRPVTLAGGQVPLELARFGTPYTWIRARLPEERGATAPPHVQINGIHLNAVWAAQAQTTEDELLGSSTGGMNQVFFFRETPVLPQERIEVRELSGARADVEWALLAREVLGEDDRMVRALEDRLKAEETQADVIEGNLRLRRDRNGRVSEVWVRWQARPNLLFSGHDERHYVVERSKGRVIFGDGRHGKVPPAGAHNVVARHYRAGGGLEGNVGAEAIEQLLGAVPYAQAVANPHPAEGGADGEALPAVHRRGPQALRHRRQAITLSDYEALAREASPAVAVARAITLEGDQGVTVIIMPQSQEPRPQPSLALRQRVEEFLAARTPATMAGRITVSGPTTYLPINVQARVAAVDPSATGVVLEEALKALQAFLHPLTGGPGRDGWPFGRDVYRSDVAAVLASVAGVDYVASLELSVDDPSIVHDEWVDVPEYHIVVAGRLDIEMDGIER